LLLLLPCALTPSRHLLLDGLWWQQAYMTAAAAADGAVAASHAEPSSKQTFAAVLAAAE
jgi:hypothetical protein